MTQRQPHDAALEAIQQLVRAGRRILERIQSSGETHDEELAAEALIDQLEAERLLTALTAIGRSDAFLEARMEGLGEAEVQLGGRSLKGQLTSINSYGAGLELEAPIELDVRLPLGHGRVERTTRVRWVRGAHIGVSFELDPDSGREE